MRILVCDDNKKRGNETLAEIAAGTRHDTELLSERDLVTEIAKLFDLARSVLETSRSSTTNAGNARCAFQRDDVDIAILDNNLSELKIAGARHTAESIAGYVRAFGKIPYVVSLNKNPQVDFDLRYLVGDYQTQADLALNDKHLSNCALWTGNPETAEFLPWYWPALNDVAHHRRRQIEFVAEHLDDPILEVLDFPKSASDRLSRHARGALSPEARSVRRVTFKKFFIASCRSLPVLRERRALASSIASEKNVARDVVCRVVAAELDRWIRRDLIGPQDVLVDLPHLLMRMPFLLGGGAHDLQRWNEIVTATSPPYELPAEIYRDHLEAARFTHELWTKSPCFWWRKLKSNVELNRMFFREKVEWAAAVFCEDLSRFMLSEAETPTEFAAEFEGSWTRRYVAIVKGRHYTPRSRFAK